MGLKEGEVNYIIINGLSDDHSLANHSKSKLLLKKKTRILCITKFPYVL